LSNLFPSRRCVSFFSSSLLPCSQPSLLPSHSPTLLPPTFPPFPRLPLPPLPLDAHRLKTSNLSDTCRPKTGARTFPRTHTSTPLTHSRPCASTRHKPSSPLATCSGPTPRSCRVGVGGRGRGRAARGSEGRSKLPKAHRGGGRRSGRKMSGREPVPCILACMHTYVGAVHTCMHAYIRRCRAYLHACIHT